jgi:hypothetical protein
MKHIFALVQPRSFFLTSKVNRSMMATTSMRNFSSGINKGHNYNDDQANFDEAAKQRILEREKAVFNSLSEKE